MQIFSFFSLTKKFVHRFPTKFSVGPTNYFSVYIQIDTLQLIFQNAKIRNIIFETECFLEWNHFSGTKYSWRLLGFWIYIPHKFKALKFVPWKSGQWIYKMNMHNPLKIRGARKWHISGSKVSSLEMNFFFFFHSRDSLTMM